MSTKTKVYLLAVSLLLVTPIILAVNYPYPEAQSRLEVFINVLAMEVAGWAIVFITLLSIFTISETYKNQ